MFSHQKKILEELYRGSKLETPWHGVLYGQISDLEYETYLSPPLSMEELIAYQKYLREWYLYTKDELPEPFKKLLLEFSNGAILFNDIIIPGHKRKYKGMTLEEKELQPAGIEEITSLSWMPNNFFVIGKSVKRDTLYLLNNKESVIEIKDKNVSYHHNKMDVVGEYDNIYSWLEKIILAHSYSGCSLNKGLSTTTLNSRKGTLRAEWNEPLALEEIQRFENAYGVELPTEYREFLLEHNGGEIDSPAGPTVAMLSLDRPDNAELYVEKVEDNVLQVALESDGEPVFLNCITGEVFQNQEFETSFSSWDKWLEYEAEIIE
ncbi:SMI1/KNR4 family protein [Listeria booriae]|uniref:SMI1/KNR4 family protein n=1 Tax=Listeria booriae TaxID=1552123 RepID=A0A7X0ZV18_9LIST|nr:SMI1/KNR4 family protein [Listeria booriae]MBC2283437.1 SMI1/KNR4 family protein [Listeria booriae]MBC2291768.1 SMI1/KNR4 family protein [Listeria booriae]MBC2311040.1 SMI1/KNR4 family protein [Listeria booriae]